MRISTRLQFREAEEHIEKGLGDNIDDLLVFPKYVVLETVNTCNARCVMCPIDFSKPAELMSDDLFDKIVNDLAEHREQVRKVMLYMDGEPLIDKGLPEKIKKLKKAGIKIVNISTNASLLDQKRGTRLLESGLDEIYINIDSLKKEVFEEIRVGLNFDDVYNNTTNFISLRNQLNPNLIIRIQVVVQEKNYTEVLDWGKHWEPFLKKNDQLVANQAHNWGSQVDVMKFDQEEGPNDFPCQSLWGTFTIHQDGIVTLCCADTHRKIPIGNMNEQKVVEVWRKSDELNKVREYHIGGQREKVSICDGCTTWKEYKHIIYKVMGGN